MRKKKEKCAELGIRSLEFTLPAETKQEELLALIAKLNSDPSVHGILCQLPLPEHFDEQTIVRAVRPEKDVDGFTCRISADAERDLMPCTPAGVMEMLRYAGISVAGKRCCVVGRSNIVGKPMATLLLLADGTVTVCHSRTKDLPAVTREADILVAAVGKPRFITADMVKEGAAVIDVGVNRGADKKILGDVDFDAVEKKASFITPVPGGVGVMTIAMLMKNTVRAAALQNPAGQDS